MATVTNGVRQALPVLVTAADVSRERNSQGSVRRREPRRELCPEGVVLMESPPSEPEEASLSSL
jgi:hypothetical protein